MDHSERVLTTVNHQEPDFVPTAIWGSTHGITAPLYFGLLKLLNLGEPVPPFRLRKGHTINCYDGRLLACLEPLPTVDMPKIKAEYGDKLCFWGQSTSTRRSSRMKPPSKPRCDSGSRCWAKVADMSSRPLIICSRISRPKTWWLYSKRRANMANIRWGFKTGEKSGL
jgi:hypothetical protein